MFFPSRNSFDGWELLTYANREIARVMEPNIFRYHFYDEQINNISEDEDEFIYPDSNEENEYLIDYSYEDSFSDISDCESPEPCLYDDMDGNEEYEVNSDNEWVTA